MDKKIALLIDAENVSSKYIKYLTPELAKYGTATYKRIYGDWTDSKAESWKKVLLEQAITPIQQYSYTTGKNSSDSAMIIDAMDILYSDSVDGFCIVSSDSDFTKLALRLREAGKYVIGMGERKTPLAFRNACEKFVFLEVLLPDNKPQAKPAVKPQGKKEEHCETNQVFDKDVVIKAIRDIIDDLSDESGWAYLGDIFNNLNKQYPEFDSRIFGFRKSSDFIKSLKDHFVTEARSSKGQGSPDTMYVKIK